MIKCLLSCIGFLAVFLSANLAVAEGNTLQSLALDGGAKGLLISDSSLPMVTLQLNFTGAGALSDPADKAGRAYLAAELLSEGAGEWNAQAFRQQMEEKAIKIGAGAGQDNLAISVKTLSEHLPTAIELLTAMLTKPRFEKASFMQVKSQLQSELKLSAQDPAWQAWMAWNKQAYGTHAYSRPTQGSEASIAALSPSDAKQWHQTTLSRNRLQIAAVGDVTTSQLQTLLAPLLAALPAEAQTEIPASASPIPVGLQPIIIPQEVPQSVAIFGFPSVSRSHPDFYAAYIMNHILGGGSLVSRLSHTIREQKGLAYSISSALSQNALSSTLQGNFATRNEQIGEAVTALEGVLTRYAKKGATAKELQSAKNYITGSFALGLDTQSDRAGFLSAILTHDLGVDYLEKRNGYFNAVTLAQVNRLAKEMLTSAPLLVVAGKPSHPLTWSHHHDTPLPSKH